MDNEKVLYDLVRETREDVKAIREKVEANETSLAVTRERMSTQAKIIAGVGVFMSMVASTVTAAVVLHVIHAN